MFKVSATSVDASVQTLAKAGDRLNPPAPMKTEISLNQLNNFAQNFQRLLGRKSDISMTRSFVQQY